MSGWVFRIGIIAVIAIGALVFRDRLSGNAGDLKVGDCFDEPVGQQEVGDVQHHPCNESHTAEVVYVGNMTGDDATYPTDAGFDAFIETSCLPVWEAYTGKTYATDEILALGYFVPTAKGWGDGDRGITCYVSRGDGAAMTTSLRKTP
jgi:hypothetical protein